MKIRVCRLCEPVTSAVYVVLLSLCFSFDYEEAGYQAADLIKMDILLNGQPVEELTTIVHR